MRKMSLKQVRVYAYIITALGAVIALCGGAYGKPYEWKKISTKDKEE